MLDRLEACKEIDERETTQTSTLSSKPNASTFEAITPSIRILLGYWSVVHGFYIFHVFVCKTECVGFGLVSVFDSSVA